MDSKEQSDALWIVIRDAVQMLNVAYLWKVPVDELGALSSDGCHIHGISAKSLILIDKKAHLHSPAL